MDNERDGWLKFLSYLPIIFAFGLAFGILDLSIYYAHYNVNILPYLDFNEVISQFLTGILPTLGLLVAARLFRFLFVSHGPLETKNEKLHNLIMIEPNFKKAIIGYFRISPHLWAFVLNLAVYPFLLIFTKDQSQIVVFIMLFSALMLVITILPGEIQRVHNLKYHKLISNQYIFMFHFTLALLAVAT